MDVTAAAGDEVIRPALRPVPRRELSPPQGVDALALAACLEGATLRPRERTDHQLHRLAAIGSLELATNLTEGPGPTIKRIVQVTHPLLPRCGGVSVILFDHRVQGFVTSASTVPDQEDGTAATRVRKSRGATRFIVESGHGLYVRDTREDPFTANRMLEETNNRSYVGLPIRAGGEVLGVLYAMGAEPDQFDAEDVELLALVADRAAVVIQAAHEHERVRRLATQQALVARASARLGASEHPGLLVREVLEGLAPALGLDVLAFLPADPGPDLPTALVSSRPVGWATNGDLDAVAAGLEEQVARGAAVVERLDVGASGGALLVAIRDDGHLHEVDRVTLDQVALLVSSTVSRARAVAEIRASNEALAQFAHVVGHDLRSPLASVAGLVEVVLVTEGDALSAEGRECAERAVAATHRMAQTMQALLDSAKVRVGDVKRSSVDLSVVVDQVLTDLADPITVSGATVEVEALPMAWVDEAAFRVVVQNLVANALKFSRPDVPPVISISGAARVDGGVQFVVSDQGIGVPVDDRERVFGMFDRGTDPTREGSGIGLSTVQRIVDAHGGRVWLEPNRPHGTNAVVELPARPVWLEAEY